MPIDAGQIIEFILDPSKATKLSPVEQSDLIIILRHQKILARFAFFSKRAGVFEQFLEQSQRHLKNALKIAEKQKEQVQLEAGIISKLLKQDSDFVVFLKGAAYTLSNKPVGHGRVYSDIDILVNKAQLKPCEQTLALDGWLGQEINDYDDKYYRKWAHEIPPLEHAQRGTIIDVHHNIIPIVSKDAPTVEALKEHIYANEEGIQMLSQPAQFVHSSVHLFRNEDYSNGFRDLTDLYLLVMDDDLSQINESMLEQIHQVADELGFRYEVGLSFSLIKKILKADIPDKFIEANLNKSAIRVAFDHYIFKDVLLPQHDLLAHSKTPFKHFLAIVRGHFIKMPFALLMYHLIVKSGRNMIEAVLGKHIFTPKDEMSLANVKSNTQK